MTLRILAISTALVLALCSSAIAGPVGFEVTLSPTTVVGSDFNVEVTNLGLSQGDLTSLSMTIGDTSFNFVDAFTTGIGLGFQKLLPTAVPSKTLLVGFSGPSLSPGQSIDFEVDIDTATDFNEVLFANGVSVPNALIVASFSTSCCGEGLSLQISENPIANADGSYTFQTTCLDPAVIPLPASVILLAPVFGLLARRRR